MQRKYNQSSPIAIPTKKNKTSTREICSFFIAYQQQTPSEVDMLSDRRICTQEQILSRWLKDKKIERKMELEEIKHIAKENKCKIVIQEVDPVAQDDLQRVHCSQSVKIVV